MSTGLSFSWRSIPDNRLSISVFRVGRSSRKHRFRRVPRSKDKCCSGWSSSTPWFSEGDSDSDTAAPAGPSPTRSGRTRRIAGSSPQFMTGLPYSRFGKIRQIESPANKVCTGTGGVRACLRAMTASQQCQQNRVISRTRAGSCSANAGLVMRRLVTSAGPIRETPVLRLVFQLTTYFTAVPCGVSSRRLSGPGGVAAPAP
jgi:hypothetical protein